MKQLIITPFLGISMLSLVTPYIYAQDKINAVVEFGRPCGIGRGLCSIEEIADSSVVCADIRNYIFFDGLSRINLKIQKSSLSREIEYLEFKDRSSYLIDEDFQLLKEKNLDKPLIIPSGAHPLIEMDEYYIISFTIKE
jgi:hypothetical protein